MRPRDQSTGIILFAHGSAVEEANRGVHELARTVESQGRYGYVRAAFLDCAQPDLAAAIRQAAEAGISHVVVIPFFLTLGIHLRRDLPQLLAVEKARHPNLEIEVGQSLEGHPQMPALILGRIGEVLGGPKAAR